MPYFTDTRAVHYYAPVRILHQTEECKDTEKLLNRAGVFQSIWGEPGAHIPPGGSILLDFGEERSGGVRMVTGQSETHYLNMQPCSIRLRFGESVSEAMHAPVNHHGMHDLPLKLAPMGETCFGTTGFRFVRIDNTDPRISIHLLECSARIPQYDIPPAGSFECSDPLLNDIFRAFRRTVDNCMCPLITDGAKRDKLVWMGDLFPEIRAVCAIYGNHPAVPATLDFLLNESAGTAIFNNMEVYTPYIFLCTSEYLRRCRADQWLKDRAADMILTAKAMLDRYDANPENVMNQGIIDWCEKDGIAPFGYQALFAAGVKACGGIMKRLHQADTAERCQRTYRAVQQAYQRRTLSKSAASIAVYAGLADASETCREVLLKRPLNGLSTFHADFILSALSRGGCHAEAMELLRAYYGAMLNLGSTTFWEHFELSWTKNAGRIDELPAPGEKDIHKSCGRLCFKGLRNSLCHGWSAGPAAWMTENILGLSPESLSRGSRKIICNPRESGLEWVRGSCPTPFGIVSAEIENGKIMSLKVNH